MFTVLDKDNAIWFIVGDNPLCVMFYDGFLIYASTQEILCKAIKKLRLKAPTDILEPKEGEILKIDRAGQLTTGSFTPNTTFERWWRKYPYYRSYYEDTPANYDDLFSVAKHLAFQLMRYRLYSTTAARRRRLRKCSTIRPCSTK